MLFVFGFAKRSGRAVVVNISGTEIVLCDLDKVKSGVYPLNKYGADMEVEIKNGAVSIRRSSCANQTCVHMSPVKNAGAIIVCIPNRVSVKVKGEIAGSKFDIVMD